MFCSSIRDETLADGFDVTDARVILLERRDQPQRRGRFAVVLARGGNENSRRGGIHRMEWLVQTSASRAPGSNQAPILLCLGEFLDQFFDLLRLALVREQDRVVGLDED